MKTGGTFGALRRLNFRGHFSMMHLPTSAQTGRMTAVMRAVRVEPQPKILRVGILVEGRIVEERIVKQGSFPLEGARFERTDAGYRLEWSRGITGRIALAGKIIDLAGEGSLLLTDDARGKIHLGRVTLLFQLVEPPPAQARPQLPLAVKAGLPVDWRLTIIAALSFLAHFGFVGALYSDWTDLTVDDEGVNIQGLVDLSRTSPATPLEDRTDPVTPTDHSTTSATTATATHANNAEARAAALSRQAEAMQMEILGAFGGSSAIDNALRRSNVPSPNLDDAAKANTGGKGAEDLKLSNRGVLIDPGTDGIARLGVKDGNANHHAVATDVEGPKTNVDFTVEKTTGGVPVHNLEASIALLRPGFRSCYNKGVAVQPDMQGKMVALVRLAPNGEVTSVDKVDGTGLSEGVEACVMKKIKNGSFDAPGGSGSQFRLPIGFYTQKPQ